jgi:hypothetical protein
LTAKLLAVGCIAVDFENTPACAAGYESKAGAAARKG